MNITCVICSDLFISADNVFSTPCGHIFHHVCLIQWMERKKDCPQCRQKCNERNIFRIYFNNIQNLDTSTTSSANLIEKIDNLTLQAREKEIALKNLETQKAKLEESLQSKDKKIKKLDILVSQNNQILATMRHEIDLLSSNKASYKNIETENAQLKSKLELMQTVESVLSASQKEIDEVLKQDLNPRDLAVMVGTLRRELNCTEIRKNELRKQLQTIKCNLREEQDEKKKLQERISYYESKTHSLLNRLKKTQTASFEQDSLDISVLEENKDIVEIDTPESFKKRRLALMDIDDQNTPSPLGRDELKKRIQKIQESDSPYFKVKASSIALACARKRPMQAKEIEAHNQQTKSVSDDVTKLSIFRKPRIGFESNFQKPDNVAYNGLGGTKKILQSELKEAANSEINSFWSVTSKPRTTFKKNVSALAIKK